MSTFSHFIFAALFSLAGLVLQSSLGACQTTIQSQKGSDLSDPFQGYPEVKSRLARMNDEALPTDQRINSAREAIKAAQATDNSILKLHVYVAAADSPPVQSDIIEYKNVLELASEIGEKVNAPALDARIFCYKAKYFNRIRRYKKAIEWVKKAQTSKLLSKRDLVTSNIVLGVACGRLGLLEQAFAANQEVLALAGGDTEVHQVRIAKNNIAWLLVRLKKYEKATAVYDELEPVEHAQTLFLRVKLGRCEIALGRNEVDRAMELSESAIEVGKTIQEIEVNEWAKKNRRGLIGLLYLIQARCFYEREDYSAAQTACEQAIELIKTSRPHRLNDARVILGFIVAKKGRPELGVEMVRKAYESASAAKQFYSVLIASEKLTKLYEDNGQFDKAYQQLKTTKELENSLKVEDMELRLEFTELRHQAKLEQRRLELTTTEERAKTKQAKLVAKNAISQVEKSKAIQYGFGFAFALILLGSTGYLVSQVRRKKIQDQLADVKKQAEFQEQVAQKKRIEDIGALTGSVAHDFNNILQVVCQINFLIEDSLGEDLTSAQEKMLETESNAVDVASKITQQLLTYARRQATAPKVERVSTMLESTQALFDSVSDSIQVNVLKFDETLAINVDPTQFSSSILNLLLNARDAMEGTGLIEIQVTNEAIVESTSSPLPDGDYVCIKVSDAGKGMNEEQLRRACEPFFTTKPPTTGTGLGLSTVEGFVEQAGGAINIESTFGCGASVYLYFPKANCTAEFDQSVKSDFTTANTNERVCLIVEDNPMVRSTLELSLHSCGYKSTCCCSADDAHDLLKSEQNFSLVVSDIRMPGKWDGVDLAQWIKSTFPGIKIVLISGNDAPPELDDFIFLRKPFRLSDLQSVLETEHVHQ